MPKVKTIPRLITIYCNLLDCIATIVVHKVQQIALSSYGVKAMDQAPGYVNCGHIASVKKVVSFKIYTTCAKPLSSIFPMAIKI